MISGIYVLLCAIVKQQLEHAWLMSVCSAVQWTPTLHAYCV